VHNAAWYEVGVSKKSQKLMHEINVTGTDNVLSLALELGISRVVYVSSALYYGNTGSEMRDETFQRQEPFYFYYEQTKAEAHEIAQQYEQRGLPLVIACPAHVVGPNDHSIYGYFLRMYLNQLMPPYAWAGDTIHSPVHVNDVAGGIALTAEKGRMGETYVLAGQSTKVREVLQIWGTHKGRFKVRFYIPFWLATLTFAPMGPLLRWIRLPAFISRETVAASKVSLTFSSAKAQQELGWAYRSAGELWPDIIDKELQLLANRKERSLVARLKPLETIE